MLRNSGVLHLGRISVAVCLLSVLPGAAVGQIIAFDNGDPNDSDPRPETVNSAYVDGWDDDDNGGYGFGPWSGLYGNPKNSDVDAPEPLNNLSTPAFQLGTGGFGYGAARTFGAPMAAGQTFQVDFDPFPFPPAGTTTLTGEFQSLFRFSAGGSERFALYAYAFYNNGAFQFGTDRWGISTGTANDNLNEGAPLPAGDCLGTIGCTNYTLTDSSDGFTFTLELPTIDTYRLRAVDDGVTKLDISGNLSGGAGAGQGVDNIYIWSVDGSTTPAATAIDYSYFTNMQILQTPSAGLDGDYNDDDVVDAADYVVWRKNPAGNGGDPGGYNTWRSNFGESASGASAGVPEPSSIMLALLSAASVVLMARRRAS